MTQADMERFSDGINNTVHSIVPRLKDFHQLLLIPPKVDFTEQQWQQQQWNLASVEILYISLK